MFDYLHILSTLPPIFFFMVLSDELVWTLMIDIMICNETHRIFNFKILGKIIWVRH